MTTADKKIFVENILTDLKQEIEKRIPKMPEEWNGFEIRQFIADYFTTNYVTNGGMKGRRRKEYKNTCLVDNLL